MKGLIYKDLLTFCQNLTFTFILVAVYACMGILSEEGSLYCIVMATVINMLLPMTVEGYDEQCGWNSFGGAMPVSRTKTVLARYCTELIIVAFSLITVLITHLVMLIARGNSIESWGYLTVITVSTITNAVITPVLYKFGVQKGRFLMMAIFLIPSIIFSIGVGFIATSESEFVTSLLDKLSNFALKLNEMPIAAICLIILAVCAVIYALSIMLSISIYKKKEL